MKIDKEKGFDLFSNVAIGLQNQINIKNKNLQDDIRSIIGCYSNDELKAEACKNRIEKLNIKFIKGSVDVRKYANTLLNEFEITQRPRKLKEWILQTCEFFLLSRLPRPYDQISENEISNLVKETPDEIFELYISNYKKSKKSDKSVIQNIKDFIKYMALAIQIFEYKREYELYNLNLMKAKKPREDKLNKEVSVKINMGNKKVPNSFRLRDYKNNEDKLTDLKRSLLEKEIISEISLGNFKKIFSGNVIEQKINWIGDKGQLRYLIIKLHNQLKLVEEMKRGYWIVASKCFSFDNKEISPDKLRNTNKLNSDAEIDSVLKALS